VKIDRFWLIYVSHGRAAQIPADARVAYVFTESIQQKKAEISKFFIPFYFSHLTDKNSPEKGKHRGVKSYSALDLIVPG
jgi:hypothetical protein